MTFSIDPVVHSPHFKNSHYVAQKVKVDVDLEKCNFCAERLEKGQAPACVEAANQETEATIIFGDLSDYGSDVRKALRENYTIRRKPELGTGPNIYYIV